MKKEIEELYDKYHEMPQIEFINKETCECCGNDIDVKNYRNDPKANRILKKISKLQSQCKHEKTKTIRGAQVCCDCNHFLTLGYWDRKLLEILSPNKTLDIK